jgi:hypothetical protein
MYFQFSIERGTREGGMLSYQVSLKLHVMSVHGSCWHLQASGFVSKWWGCSVWFLTLPELARKVDVSPLLYM